MREAIPTDLLLRLMNASTEQFAAVERALGIKAESENRKADMEDEADEVVGPTTEEVARSAFALLEKLDRDAPLKAPSALTVFRLYCVDGLSAERVARRCRCGKAAVIRRLQFIEQRTGVKAEQYRAMSGHLQRIDDDLSTSGAREVYRRGLAAGE